MSHLQSFCLELILNNLPNKAFWQFCEPPFVLCPSEKVMTTGINHSLEPFTHRSCKFTSLVPTMSFGRSVWLSYEGNYAF